jgi:hypothetical protein
MIHYIAFLVPTDLGEWQALFPDVPECEARGVGLENAKVAAAAELTRRIQANGAPHPRDLTAIERDYEWLSRNGVDLTKAVVTIIPVGG